jgi:hypothetical protein
MILNFLAGIAFLAALYWIAEFGRTSIGAQIFNTVFLIFLWCVFCFFASIVGRAVIFVIKEAWLFYKSR